MNSFKILLVFLFPLFAANLSFAQTQQDTLKVLFVGNSYTYVSNIPHLVSVISDSLDTKLITAKSTAAGASLSEHWKGDRGLNTKELIQNDGFDIVVLQEQSMGAIEQPDSLLVYVKKFSDYIRRNGAKPYLYATWAREKTPQLQTTITDVYSQSANENETGIVLVGEVWAAAFERRPNIDPFWPDGSHQTPLGAFLAACAFVKGLTGELPNDPIIDYREYSVLDAEGESVYLLSLEAADITFCRNIVNVMANQ